MKTIAQHNLEKTVYSARLTLDKLRKQYNTATGAERLRLNRAVMDAENDLTAKREQLITQMSKDADSRDRALESNLMKGMR